MKLYSFTRKRLTFLFLFLILFSLRTHASIGISPPSIKMDDSSSFYIINSANNSELIYLNSSVVYLENKTILLGPKMIKKINLRRSSKESGTLEVLYGREFVKSLVIPVIFKQNNSLNTNEEGLITKKQEGESNFNLPNVLVFILLIFIGVVGGIFLWMRESY